MTATDVAHRPAAGHRQPADPSRRTLMSWLALVAAIACDVAATYALAASHGFRNMVPSVLAVLGFLLTTYLFGVALTRLGPSVSYAAFGALGTTAVAVIGIALGTERANWLKTGSLALIIIGVALLPLADHRDKAAAPPAAHGPERPARG
ncbi:MULTISPECIES: DMT family transporter [unclassified Frankia]|uniref:DMT family transporter n=1 Tax=unclassified Frankia TaxID=2632575 RepID=UPI0020257281